MSLFGVVASGTDRSPEDIARSTGFGAAVAGLVADAAADSDRARWSLLILGLILMLWAGYGTVRAATLASVLAWGLPRDRVKRSGPYGSVIFSLVAASTATLQTVASEPFSDGQIGEIGSWVAISIVVGGLAALAMWLLPHGAVSKWGVVPGAVLFAAALRGLSLATDVYFAGRLDRVGDLYGGLGIAVVILLYLFVAARAFVWGQFLNATIAVAPPANRTIIAGG